MQQITLELDCKLDDLQVLRKGEEIATKMVKYDAVEEEKKVLTKMLGDQMKDIRAEVSLLAKQISNRTETRSVKCTVELNVPVIGTKRITRLDTGELVKEEAMTPEERQTNLFSEEPKKNNKTAVTVN